jgi:hypothetical protein
VSGTETQEQRTHGSLAAAISRHVVRVVSEYTGQGPTKARSSIRDNVVVCVTVPNGNGDRSPASQAAHSRGQCCRLNGPWMANT